MNIYLVSQNVNRGYDSYDSFVVVADSIDDAKNIHPRGDYTYDSNLQRWVDSDNYGTSSGCWCIPSDVDVELIGVTDKYTETTVICSSFNAG